MHSNLCVWEEENENKERHPPKTSSRYYKYHETGSHWTEDYMTMKKRVTELVGTGKLERMVVEHSKPRWHHEFRHGTRRSSSLEQWRQHLADGCQNNRDRAPIREIQIIAGGFAEEGVSTSSQKVYARRERYDEVYVTDRAHKHQMTISFEGKDREGVLYPHDDALVLTIVIANYRTRWVLIDNGSSADILFWEAFAKMGINTNKLRPYPMPLKGFSRDTI